VLVDRGLGVSPGAGLGAALAADLSLDKCPIADPASPAAGRRLPAHVGAQPPGEGFFG